MKSATAPTALERALRFTPAELDANRHGRLSPRQEREVAALYRTVRGKGLFAGGVIVAWAVGISAWTLTQARPNLLPDQIRSTAVLMGLFAVVMAGSMYLTRRRNTNLRERQISVAEGVAETYTTMADGELIVGDLHAIVTHRQLKGFEAERSYRVYHVALGGQSHILLSAEEL